MDREIKDIRNRITQQLVYPRTHINAVEVDNNTTLGDILEKDILTRIENLENNTNPSVALATFMEGTSFVNTLTNIPITYRLVIASISSDSSLTLKSIPSIGREIHIIIHNVASDDIAITLPDSGRYINTQDSVMSISANSYGEINLISDGNLVYIKYI